MTRTGFHWGVSIGENQAGSTRVAWEDAGEEYDQTVHRWPAAPPPSGNLGLPAAWDGEGETG